MHQVRFDELQPNEVDLIGAWVPSVAGVEGDLTCRRIRWLIEARLERVGAGDWAVLYVDPHDGRLWELTYPHSEMHGGGPPRLTAISLDDARAKYDYGAA